MKVTVQNITVQRMSNHMTNMRRRHTNMKTKQKKCQPQLRLCLKRSHNANQPLLHYKRFALVRLLTLRMLYLSLYSQSRLRLQLRRCQPAITHSC